MADVTLTLTANNSDYIRRVKEAQEASQKLYATAERSMRREKGLIEDIETELGRLQEGRKKAWTVDDIEKYNKKIAEAKKDLKEYEKIGVEAHEKVAKSGNKLKAVYVGIVAAIASAVASFRILKNAVMETETGFNNFNIVLATSKQLLYDIIQRTPIKEWIKNMKEVAGIQHQLNELRKIERKDLKDIATDQVLYRRYMAEAGDQLKTLTERSKSYDYALTALNRSLDLEGDNIAKRLALVRAWLETAPDNLTLLEEETALNVKLIEIEEKREVQKRRITSIQSGIDKQIMAENERLYLATLKLLNKPDEAAGSLMGLILFGEGDVEIIKNVIAFRKKMDIELGELAKSSEKWYKQGEKDLDTLKKAQEEVRDAQIDNFEQAGNAVIDYISIIDDLAQREIDEAQRNRELFDTRISETQRALEAEIELYKAGYASNVTLKKQELEELKKARAKALLEEEKARKKEHTLKVAQLLAEQAVAIAKIIMAAEVAKMSARAMMSNPITLIPGAALLASVKIAEAISLAAVAASAVAASLSKFAKGGWTGDKHGGFRDETGEEVAGTVHKEEYVVKRGPARKFREVLDAINKEDRGLMINRFNKITPEVMSVNNITVDNNGSNNRLDRVNSQLYMINKKLEPRKETKEQITDNGNELVYQRGNTIRTVRK